MTHVESMIANCNKQAKHYQQEIEQVRLTKKVPSYCSYTDPDKHISNLTRWKNEELEQKSILEGYKQEYGDKLRAFSLSYHAPFANMALHALEKCGIITILKQSG